MGQATVESPTQVPTELTFVV